MEDPRAESVAGEFRMILVDDMRHTMEVELPPAIAQSKDSHCAIFTLLSGGKICEAKCFINRERSGIVLSARLELDDVSIYLSFTKAFRGVGAEYEIHAPNAEVVTGRLNMGLKASWKAHPGIVSATASGYARGVVDSWLGLPRFIGEKVQGDQPGFRVPQLGALHAIAAHWSVRSTHAKIVLPTGTGKTDVMIAAGLLRGAKKVLVIVPSDALRTQISEKFSKLGILRQIAAIPESTQNPVVGMLLRSPRRIEDTELIRSANVVVSTAQMLLGADDGTLKEILALFDLVIFDEAHHLPAASWTRISGVVNDGSAVLSLTATPYRNDGRRVPGELIYQFPLKLAQQLGYFSTIAVVRVDELDPERADVEIASAAVHALRADEAGQNFRHLIMARAKSREHADKLQELYQGMYPELKPVLLHSGVGVEDRRAAISQIRSQISRVVVCVDMLGEGVDIPSLKIAALHDSHRSLPVTLQFIGRFTRSTSTVGSATVVLNIAEPMANTAIAELFAEDADWNDIVPELSKRATGREEAASEFLSNMRALVNPVDRRFDLGLVSAKTSVEIFRATQFNPGRFEKALSRASRLHQSWVSDDKQLGIFVTHDLTYPNWSTSKDAVSYEWNLTLAAFDDEKKLLFVNSTYGNSRVLRLARAIGGSNALLVEGERMFRVFDGLRRSVLYNVGLRRRGQLRFQMLAGVDIGEQVNAAVQAGSTKSNLFAVGYEDGSKRNVGASAKGRLWSMSALTVPEWRTWCGKMATKVLDDSIATDSFLRFTLIPREVQARPAIEPFACVPPDELLPGFSSRGRAVSCYGHAATFTEIDLSFENVLGSGDYIRLELALGDIAGFQFQLSWAPRFEVRQVAGPRISITDSNETAALDAFLTTHPPAILLRDGSELVGKDHFSYPSNLPYTFSPDSILALDWGQTPLKFESKWKNGVQRSLSIQGFMIDRCLERDATFVFDDDDTGEAADIIMITERRESHELDIDLYHCKYASRPSAGARFEDLYVVCGQAVKSSRLMNRPDVLLTHMIRREQRLGGRPTRFERGSLTELRSLLRRLPSYRAKLNISIVQPGISAQALTPELSTVLGAADGFVLDFTGRRLKVFGSA